MRQNLFQFILLPLLCLLFVFSCEKEREPLISGPDFNPDELPEATQEGLNTFGCKINGKVWRPRVPALSITQRAIEARFDEKSGMGSLNISCKIIENDINEWLQIEVFPTTFKPSKIFATANGIHFFTRYRLSNQIDFLIYKEKADNNILEITKVDTVNNIISGLFNLELYKDTTKLWEKMSISEGRFDLTYTPY